MGFHHGVASRRSRRDLRARFVAHVDVGPAAPKDTDDQEGRPRIYRVEESP